MRFSARALAVAALAGTVLGAGAVVALSPEPETPKQLVPKLEQKRIADAIDSVKVVAWREEIGAAARAETAAAVRARRAERSAATSRRAADSLAAEARLARTLADSARGWEVAYVKRTEEADSLASANAELNVALGLAHRQIADYVLIDSTLTSAKARADRILADAVAVANEAGKCRLLGVVRCPTRKEAIIGGVAAGVLVGSGAAKPVFDAVGSMVSRIF